MGEVFTLTSTTCLAGFISTFFNHLRIEEQVGEVFTLTSTTCPAGFISTCFYLSKDRGPGGRGFHFD